MIVNFVHLCLFEFSIKNKDLEISRNMKNEFFTFCSKFRLVRE